ncbi:hypothetical protein L7F22_029020 [Adiantum nelumboides]|nr:hypothetical protein [Adiantum nelumboides]
MERLRRQDHRSVTTLWKDYFRDTSEWWDNWNRKASGKAPDLKHKVSNEPSYVQQNNAKKALDCYERMRNEGLSPDAVTFSCILKACGCVGASEIGEGIHFEIDRMGMLKKDIVLNNALVDMYAKCGIFYKARQVLFKELPARDVVSWDSLLAGYAQHGHDDEALHCLEQMQHEGFPPNEVIFACALKEVALKIPERGYSPSFQWVTRNVSDDAKKEILCEHSEKLAVACALINTPNGAPIRVKNMQMCGDCHAATSLLSKVEKRAIRVKDANRVHASEDGRCSCGDYW